MHRNEQTDFETMRNNALRSALRAALVIVATIATAWFSFTGATMQDPGTGFWLGVFYLSMSFGIAYAVYGLIESRKVRIAATAMVAASPALMVAYQLLRLVRYLLN